jgi:hypothetical protein
MPRRGTMSKQEQVKDALQKLGCIDVSSVLRLLNKDIQEWNPNKVTASSFASHLMAKYSLNKID